MLLATIARSNLGLGRVEEALGAAEEAVEIMEARGFTVFALEAPIALARVLNSSGDAQAAERIESVLARALEVARASAARIFEPQIHRELAALARLRGDEAAAEREEAEAERILAEIQSGPGRDGDPSAEQHPDQVLLDQNYAASLLLSGREREGLALARQANQRATRSSDPGLKLTASCGEVLANAIAGSAEDGLAAVVRGLEAAGDDTAAGAGLVFACPYGLALSFRGFCAGAIGHTDRAAQDFERAIEVTRSHGDRESESYAHSNRAFVDEMSGQVGPATLTHSQRAFDLAEQAGNPLAGAAASTAWAVAEVATGSLAEGLERADSTLTTIRERGTGLHYIPALLTSIALARLGLGDRGAALASAEEAVDIMNSRGLTVCALLAPITLAWLLIETEGAAAGDRIEAILARATDVVEKSGARVFEPQIRELADQLAVR
jgi:tetratricopeptide (TPR) repeat protein